jgi:hypothetical protein
MEEIEDWKKPAVIFVDASYEGDLVFGRSGG